MSISKSQAELLASGFLDTLGSNPEENDLVLDETLTTLIQLAGALVERAGDNLHEGGHISTGNLASSFKVLDPEMQGKLIRLDVEALKYYQFLNKGVKGTKGGSGEFSFRTSFPSRKMVTAILNWLKISGKTSFNVKKPVSNLERKRKSVSNIAEKSAYAVARSIKLHGIKKTGFFDKAVLDTQSDASELGKALKIDVINSLRNVK